MEKYTTTPINSVRGTNQSLYILKRDGQAVSSIAKPFNAYGVRKVLPSVEELVSIKAENNRRSTILDSFLTKWENSGVIDKELLSQLQSFSPVVQ